MDKLIQKITGIAVGTVLAVSLSGKAYAENAEQPVLPDNPPEIIEQASAEEAAAEVVVEEKSAPAPAAAEPAVEPAAVPAVGEAAAPVLTSVQQNVPVTKEASSTSAEEAVTEVAPSEETDVSETADAADEEPAPEEVTEDPASGQEETEEGNRAADALPPDSAPAAETPAEESPAEEEIRDTLSGAEETAVNRALADSVPADGTVPADSADATSGSIQFDGATIGGTEVNWDNWADNQGWRYESERLTIVNCQGYETIPSPSLDTGDESITIVAAGTNHLTSIRSNADVNIIGTGILLVDEVELGENGKVNLLPNSDLYKEGGVAVFLKQEDGSYLLVNGSVPGILDEACSVPDGVKLVIPEGSTLQLETLVQETDLHSYDSTIYSGQNAPSVRDLENKDYDDSYGRLYVPENSTLEVQKGAVIKMHSVDLGTDTETGKHSVVAPRLPVYGTLVVDGTISGGFTEFYPGSMLQTGSASVDYDAIFEAVKAHASWEMPDGSPVMITSASADGNTGDDVDYTVAESDPVQLPINLASTGGHMHILLPQAHSSSAGTGTGIVSGESSGNVNGGTPVTILSGAEEPEPPVEPTPPPVITPIASVQLLRVEVIHVKDQHYELRVYLGNTRLRSLSGMSVQAQMDFEIPEDWEIDAIYVVFRNADGSLTVFKAVYDPIAHTLTFRSTTLGDFVVVNMADFNGEPFSEEFYAALNALAEVAALGGGSV